MGFGIEKQFRVGLPLYANRPATIPSPQPQNRMELASPRVPLHPLTEQRSPVLLTELPLPQGRRTGGGGGAGTTAFPPPLLPPRHPLPCPILLRFLAFLQPFGTLPCRPLTLDQRAAEGERRRIRTAAGIRACWVPKPPSSFPWLPSPPTDVYLLDVAAFQHCVAVACPFSIFFF